MGNAHARQGYSPAHGMPKRVPDGYLVKGVSTLYDADGNIRQQWVKSHIDNDRQRQLLAEAIEAMCEDVPRIKPTRGPRQTPDHLPAVSPTDDPHIGTLSSSERTRA